MSWMEYCEICFQDIGTGSVGYCTSCDNDFHQSCLELALIRSERCPVCREKQSYQSREGEVHCDICRSPITAADFEEAVTGHCRKCGDHFHYRCISSNDRMYGTCPSCRDGSSMSMKIPRKNRRSRPVKKDRTIELAKDAVQFITMFSVFVLAGLYFNSLFG